MSSKEEIFEDDKELLVHGMRSILHNECPARKIEKCEQHSSDGHVYDDTPIYITLFCTNCKTHYDVNKITGRTME